MAKEYVMESGLTALNVIGLHPFKPNRIRACAFSCTFLAMYLLNVAGVLIKYEGMRTLAESVDSIPAGQQVLVKVFAVIFLRAKFRALFVETDRMLPDDVYGEELAARIASYAKSFKRIFVVYRATIWITGAAYASKPLLTFTRSFATAWYLPCDASSDGCYAAIVVAQSIYIMILAFAVVVFDFVFFAFLFKIYCELEKIKYGFRTLKIEEDSVGDDEGVLKEFSDVVKHHAFLLRLMKNLDNIYSMQLLNHITTISATIVFGIFFMNMDGFPPSVDNLCRYIPYLTSYNFQLYIYCVIGQEIADQAHDVGNALYNSNWYINHQPKLNKQITLVLQIAQQEQNQLTIGNIWKLNLAIFMSVIKTSISFHAFMQTMYMQN